MYFLLHSALLPFRRKLSTIFLAFSFFFGLLFGILLFIHSGESAVSLMRGSMFSAVSIVDFLTCALLPFLLSSFVVSWRQSGLLYLISFLEAFIFAYVSMIVIYFCPVPDPYSRWIFLFGEAISLPLLFFYWIRELDQETSCTNTWTFFLLTSGFCIGAVEYYLISSLCLF